jgi:hypothetical protein
VKLIPADRWRQLKRATTKSPRATRKSAIIAKPTADFAPKRGNRGRPFQGGSRPTNWSTNAYASIREICTDFRGNRQSRAPLFGGTIDLRLHSRAVPR